MKTITKISQLAVTGLLAGLAGVAQAQNDNEIRIGEYFIHYDAQAADASGGFVTPGLNLSVNNVQTEYFAYMRRLSPHFSLELAAGIPPKTTLVGKGPATIGSVPYSGQELATSRWFSPTALLNYSFFDESAQIRPYVGVGMNFTRFYDNTLTAAGQAAFGGPTSATLSDSTGWAATAGVSYHLQDRWNLHASYSLSQVKSDLSANTSGTIRTTSIDFKPSAFVLSVGYSF